MSYVTDYKSLERIYESDRTEVYRGFSSENQPVILKLPKEDTASERSNEIRQEYELLKSFSESRNVIHCLSLLDKGPQKGLVLEDIGGVSLNNRLKDEGIALNDFFPIALELVKAVKEVHKEKIIHKDIKPHNVVFNEKSGELKLIDFCIASRFNRESIEEERTVNWEGSLHYISPEQTGRMNRTVDYRTDFYSLGVTFYQLLTGRLPHPSKDPMEVIHGHIAKVPPAPSEERGEIPRFLSAIVMKLMEKGAEDRYQSADGLLFDLQECERQYKASGEISDFELGTRDVPESFNIPVKLYGREQSTQELLDSFNRASTGSREILFVKGSAGIGKSALINEIQKPIAGKGGYFIRGKFDQSRRNIPYTAVLQAFSTLARQILAGSEDDLMCWKDSLQEAVGTIGQVIIDVMPVFELIIGPQPEVQELPAQEAQNRFNILFQNFIKVFACVEHPLVLFIDDIQWADQASLLLLELLMNDGELGHLMIILSCRDNEIDSSHYLNNILSNLTDEGIPYTDFSVPALDRRAISELIGESLFSPAERVAGIAELVREKTDGNPFFIREFLKKLYEEGLIWYESGWHWDESRIKSAKVTGNVVELMSEKIKRLPGDSLEVLKVASCIGSEFQLDILSTVYGKNEDETFGDLIAATKEGMIVKRDDSMDFIHDRIREASYSFISSEEKSRLHARIGKILWEEHEEKGNLEDQVFNIVNQLNQGVKHLSNDEKRSLIRLNLMAGKKAKASAAFESALDFFTKAMELLSDDLWKNDYSLALELYTERAEAEFLNGNYEIAENYFDVVIQFAESVYDKIIVYELKSASKMVQKKYDETICVGLEALKLLHINIPQNPHGMAFFPGFLGIQLKLKKKDISNLINMPMMTDPHAIAVMNVMYRLLMTSFETNINLFMLLSIKMMDLTLKSGLTRSSALCFASFGIMLVGVTENPSYAVQFADLAKEIVKKFNDDKLFSFVTTFAESSIYHLMYHMRDSIPVFFEGHKAGLRSGEIQFAMINANFLVCFYPFFAGINLKEIKEQSYSYEALMKKTRMLNVILFYYLGISPVEALLGRNSSPILLDTEEYSEEEIVIALKESDSKLGLYIYYSLKIYVLFVFGEYEKILQYSEDAFQYESNAIGQVHLLNFYYIFALTLCGLFPRIHGKEKKEIKNKLKKVMSKFRKWSLDGPDNYLHKYQLINAEWLKINGKYMEAMDLYDKAISRARSNNFINDEAIANELAGKFYLSRNMDNIAKSYLESSLRCYRQWGASGKVKDLESSYPFLKKSLSRSTNTSSGSRSSSSGTGSSALDLGTVLKASQAISGEIEMKLLLERMISIVMENAGAEKGFFILCPESGVFTIAAKGDSESGVVSGFDEAVDGSGEMSQAVIRYTGKTRQTLVIADATQDDRFNSESYVREKCPKSILCVPILKQGDLIGLLYLENNLATDAFTPERLEILKVLSSQIAISIENSSLFSRLEEYNRTLESRVEERTKELADANSELETKNHAMLNDLMVAQKVQESLIPSREDLEKIKGLDLGGAYLAMVNVGGDIYDAVQIDDDHVGLLMADVSGHGVSAALVTSMAKVSFNNHMKSGNTDTGEIMGCVNREICSFMGDAGEHDLTAFLGILNLKTGEFIFTCAAHHPAVWQKSDGSIGSLTTEDSYIGLASCIEYRTGSVQLSKGDRIVLFTDGIVEAKNSDWVLYDTKRLIKCLEENRSSVPSIVVEKVVVDVENFCGSEEADDDKAILCCDYKY